MLSKLTLRSLAAIFCIAISAQLSFAQVFWSETFTDEASSTTNWVNDGTNGGTESWIWTDDVAAGYAGVPAFASPTATTGYFLFNSDANGDFAHDLALDGQSAIDCSGRSDVRLRFYAQYAKFTAGAIAQVGVSTDGSNYTYYDLFELLPPNTLYDDWVELDINEADNEAAVYIQFRWIGQYEYHWKVDDVELSEYQAPNVDVTFRVNMITQMVSGEGVRIAGSFTGWADEAMTDQGNGVWSITKSLPVGTEVYYKFKNGSGGWEPGQAACGVDDGVGGFNRNYTPLITAVLPTVCFNSCSNCVLTCDQNPDAIICDNIDSYNTAQKLGPQATWWTTWSGAEGTNEDGIVTTEQAASAPNSFKLVSTATAGGPQDVVLNLGNKTTGNYSLKWKHYIPAGKSAYYNVQETVPIPNPNPNGNWNLDVFFDAGAGGRAGVNQADLLTFSYPSDEWFTVEHRIDLDNNLLSFYVNGEFIGKIPYPDNLGGVDFYCINNFGLFYTDDLEYVALPAVTFDVDVCDQAVDLTSLFYGSAGVPQVSSLFDNTTATASPTDPAVDCWNENVPGVDVINTSMWYTFSGTGNNYRVETVPCNATNYIGTAQDDPGDTQMAIYSGDDCSSLTLVACNDDLYADGDPDWRSSVTIETVAGENYYILIDGFQFGNLVATGEYCVEVEQIASVTCADAAVGTYTVADNGFVCNLGEFADLITLDAPGFIVPNEGPVAGMAWAITNTPVVAGVWPITGLQGSTSVLPNVFVMSIVNDANPFPYGQYYVTPIVIGGAIDTDLTNGPTLFDIDPTGGCFFVGQSELITLLPPLNPLDAVANATPETVPPGNNGSITLAVEGGLSEFLGDPSFYSFNWSNGATTQNLSNVGGGNYSVTISDITGCVAPFVINNILVTTGIDDPASVKALTLSPNPTNGLATLNLALETAEEVRIEILNTIGQVVQTINAGNVSSLNQRIDLTRFATGTYILRATIGGETAQRRIVLQR